MRDRLNHIYDNFRARAQKIVDLLASGSKGASVVASIHKEVSEELQREDTSPEWFSDTVSSLQEVLLIYEVVVLEEMFKDYARYHFTLDPKSLLRTGTGDNEKEPLVLEYKIILHACTYQKIIESMADREIYKLGRMNIDKMAKRVSNWLQADITSIDNWKEMRMAYYARNLLVHNGGIITDEYVKNTDMGTVGGRLTIIPKLVYWTHSGLNLLNERLFETLSKRLEKKESSGAQGS